MFIQTEATPNPDVLKFLPGRDVLGQGTREFRSAAEAMASPLAAAIFDLDGVGRVFFGPDFVTVTKSDSLDWPQLKAPVLAAIMEHFTSGDPTMLDGEAQVGGAAEGDSEIVIQIKDLLDTRVRPAVAQDGGDIVFHRFEDGVVYLTMQGACSGCPSSTATLKSGIENMLRHYVPEVQEVRAV